MLGGVCTTRVLHPWRVQHPNARPQKYQSSFVRSAVNKLLMQGRLMPANSNRTGNRLYKFVFKL